MKWLWMVLLAPLTLYGQVWTDTVTNSMGKPIAGASYGVYTVQSYGTQTVPAVCSSTPVTLFTDPGLGTPCTGGNGCGNPVMCRVS